MLIKLFSAKGYHCCPDCALPMLSRLFMLFRLVYLSTLHRRGNDTFGVRARQILDKIILTYDNFRDWPAHGQILPGIAWRARRHLNIIGNFSIAVGQTDLSNLWTENNGGGSISPNLAETSLQSARAPQCVTGLFIATEAELCNLSWSDCACTPV